MSKLEKHEESRQRWLDSSVSDKLEQLYDCVVHNAGVFSDQSNLQEEKINIIENTIPAILSSHNALCDRLKEKINTDNLYKNKIDKKIEDISSVVFPKHNWESKHAENAESISETAKKSEENSERKSKNKAVEEIPAWFSTYIYNKNIERSNKREESIKRRWEKIYPLNSKFKIGQVWESREGGISIVKEIIEEALYPVFCKYFLKIDKFRLFRKKNHEITTSLWNTYTEDGFYLIGKESGKDLINLLS